MYGATDSKSRRVKGVKRQFRPTPFDPSFRPTSTTLLDPYALRALLRLPLTDRTELAYPRNQRILLLPPILSTTYHEITTSPFLYINQRSIFRCLFVDFAQEINRFTIVKDPVNPIDWTRQLTGSLVRMVGCRSVGSQKRESKRIRLIDLSSVEL